MSDKTRRPVDLWHAPQPGPEYWGWRCLACSEPVAHHPGPLARFIHLFRKARS